MLISTATRDPCAGFDFDCRSPYYVDRTPFTGGRCRLCGAYIREDENTLEGADFEMHEACFTEMPPTFTLARLGFLKVPPAKEARCALCSEEIEENDECFAREGKHLHLDCFREMESEDVWEALELTPHFT